MGTERVLIADGGIAGLSLDLALRGGHLLLDALAHGLSNLNDQQRDERQNTEISLAARGTSPGPLRGMACLHA